MQQEFTNITKAIATDERVNYTPDQLKDFIETCIDLFDIDKSMFGLNDKGKELQLSFYLRGFEKSTTRQATVLLIANKLTKLWSNQNTNIL